jgi:hypothetical protein
MDSIDLRFMRIRHTGGEETQYANVFYPSQFGNYYPNQRWDVYRNYSYIADNVHRYLKGTRRFPNGNCVNDKVDTTNLHHIDQDIFYDGGSYTRFVNYKEIYPLLNQVAINSITPAVSDATFYGLNREALNYFSEVFPQLLSASEFIQGFTQLKDMIPKVGDTVAKTFSGGYLNKKFGWDNLFSDLDTLSHITSDVQNRLDYLIRTYGVPTRLGFARPFVDLSLQPGATYWNRRPAGHASLLTLLDARCTMRATATIVQTLDYIHGVIGLVRGFASALGLDNPVKAFWNVIPFSFVVDWFFKVSEHLDSLTRFKPAVGWDISNVSCSYTLTSKVNVSMISGNGYNPGGLLQDCGYYTRTTYRRWATLPISLADLQPEDLSPNTLVLLLALLHQQG